MRTTRVATGCGAAWLARLTGGQEVPGSNPGSPTSEVPVSGRGVVPAPDRSRVVPGRPGVPARCLLDSGTVDTPRLILTCGLPGAGKTTLAMRLAAERGAVRLTKDEWLWALGTTPWDESARVKVEHELWRLARDLLRLGVSVVLDFGLWARRERDELRTTARGLGAAVELRYLEVPTEELWKRIEARNSAPPWDSHPIRREDLDGWVRAFQAPEPSELILFDPPPAPD